MHQIILAEILVKLIFMPINLNGNVWIVWIDANNVTMEPNVQVAFRATINRLLTLNATKLAQVNYIH